MKQLLFLFPFCLAGFTGTAQQSTPFVIASGGDYFIGAGFTNSMTIGEMALVETYQPGSFILTQGFQQPEYGPTAVISGSLNGSLNCYPNPNPGMLTIAMNFTANTTVQYELFNLLGQNILAGQIAEFSGAQNKQLDLSAYESGAYFLRCTMTSAGKNTQTTTRISLVK
ncbi:MAG: hypothetical protein FD123_2999 [Bacteroidetes bacterium]|nr:MAG: hypothetical protein FD123_2999 [Bacteroidota bacterium]